MKNIIDEKQFENHIRTEILDKILNSHNDYKLFDFKKAVDILIAKSGRNPELFFIEIKYHKKSHGRLGFGSSKGSGFQPEVLRDKVDYFESNLRWILGNIESEKYWFADNDTIRNYLSGGGIGRKYNNIQAKFFREVEPITKAELIKQLGQWLMTKN